LYALVLRERIGKRMQYVTFAQPKLPIGQKRSPSYKHGIKPLVIGGFQDAYWVLLATLIVPYEGMVMFVDSKLPKKEKETFLLTSQERMHSFIHKKFNDEAFPLLGDTAHQFLTLVEKFYETVAGLLQKYVSDIVTWLVAIEENRLYYEHGIEELFSIFSGDNLGDLNKIFLWHLYEEIEHHMETAVLTLRVYGNMRFLWAPLAYPLYCVLLYSQMTFAIILFGIKHKDYETKHGLSHVFAEVGKYISALLWFDVDALVGLVLLLINATSCEEKLKKDLELYQRLFKDKYGDDLLQKSIAFGASA
jgi:hypothetical protein